jgi:hypothetical protein
VEGKRPYALGKPHNRSGHKRGQRKTFIILSVLKERLTSPRAVILLLEPYANFMSRGSVVGIETGCGMDDREVGVRVLVRSRILISPYRPDRLWSPPNLLSNGYRGLFSGGKATRA